VDLSRDEVIRLFSEFLDTYLAGAARRFPGESHLNHRPLLSFVSPCYNEAPNLPELCRRIGETCRSAGIEDYEVLLIENGSHDDSQPIMRRLSEENPRVRILVLSRNFGYQGAISCGLQHSRGRWSRSSMVTCRILPS
jgi:cellulose synthase/poly-beta-1,6-N-acetylglucosamine synthase-like glycosyltransferase